MRSSFYPSVLIHCYQQPKALGKPLCDDQQIQAATKQYSMYLAKEDIGKDHVQGVGRSRGNVRPTSTRKPRHESIWPSPGDDRLVWAAGPCVTHCRTSERIFTL